MSTAYRFRLAAVLRLRRAEHEQAALALTRANAQLRELIMTRELQAKRYAAIDVAVTTQSTQEFLRQRADTALAAAKLLQLDGAVNVAAAQAALARLSWSNTHQKLTALERLDSRRREEWALEQNRHDANDLDELATAAFVRELQSGAVSS